MVENRERQPSSTCEEKFTSGCEVEDNAAEEKVVVLIFLFFSINNLKL